MESLLPVGLVLYTLSIVAYTNYKYNKIDMRD
jgi:hypothetical protein